MTSSLKTNEYGSIQMTDSEMATINHEAQESDDELEPLIKHPQNLTLNSTRSQFPFPPEGLNGCCLIGSENDEISERSSNSMSNTSGPSPSNRFLQNNHMVVYHILKKVLKKYNTGRRSIPSDPETHPILGDVSPTKNCMLRFCLLVVAFTICLIAGVVVADTISPNELASIIKTLYCYLYKHNCPI